MSTNSFCHSCLALEKQLKVQKADYEFQLKKVKEDKSTQKAMYEIHLQKQVRKWQEAFQKQKGLRQQQNHNWLGKYDLTVIKHEQERAQLVREHQDTMRKQIERIRKQYQTELNNKSRKYEETLNQTTTKYEKQIKDITDLWEQKCKKDEQTYNTAINELKKLNNCKISEMERKFQSKITGFKSQLKKEEELHNTSKQSAKDMQSNLYQQIYSLKREITDLQNTLNQQKTTNQQLRLDISNLQAKIADLQIESQNKLSRAAQIKKQELQEQKDHYLNIIRKHREQQLKFCHQYETVILKMEDGRATQKQLYLSNIEEIRNTIDARMSRPEDMHQIEQLRDRLAKKTKQCQLMIDELKWYRLELENKEETYNKIFVPLTSNNTTNNENLIGKRKQFKLRRQGKSVTTVREILQSMNSNSSCNCPVEPKKTPLLPKPKVL